MGEWDVGYDFQGTPPASGAWDCQVTAARNGTVAHSTGDCCGGCRQRTEIDRGTIATVDLAPQKTLPSPEPNVGFWSSLFSSPQKARS